MRRLSHIVSSAVVAAGLAGSVGAPSAAAVSDTVVAGGAGPITFHPFTIPPNTGCIRWAEDGTYNCDPVNVVFPNRTPGQARDLLLAGGWTIFGLGSTQYLHFATPTLYSQSIQVFRADGRDGQGRSVRYHVRLWPVRGVTSSVTVGAVHHEDGSASPTSSIAAGTRRRRSSSGSSAPAAAPARGCCPSRVRCRAATASGVGGRTTLTPRSSRKGGGSPARCGPGRLSPRVVS